MECPFCGRHLEQHCMKTNGHANGEMFEDWNCDSCGRSFFVSWYDNNDNR